MNPCVDWQVTSFQDDILLLHFTLKKLLPVAVKDRELRWVLNKRTNLTDCCWRIFWAEQWRRRRGKKEEAGSLFLRENIPLLIVSIFFFSCPTTRTTTVSCKVIWETFSVILMHRTHPINCSNFKWSETAVKVTQFSLFFPESSLQVHESESHVHKFHWQITFREI